MTLDEHGGNSLALNYFHSYNHLALIGNWDFVASVVGSAKEKVLEIVGQAAAKLRGELGESPSTVQKFDVRLPTRIALTTGERRHTVMVIPQLLKSGITLKI